jgi:arabinan endo-1,5-alpha-L-arabinosidase
MDRRGRDRQGSAPLGAGDAGLQAAQRLGALDQPARRDSLPLLLPVELRPQCERHRPHDQYAFDPRKPDEGWRDQGLVLKSKDGDDFNAIDPFRVDLEDGRAFLAFGSFWSGIKLVRLDPETGKLIRPDAPRIALASRNGGAIEAASILEHDGRFFLFVSFDQCCRGVASTYNIRVGRADRIEGPYQDKDGKAMLEGGGSLLLATAGRFIGPGGQEAVRTSRGDMLAYHYYDGDAAGVSKLQFSPLLWTADGWPELGPPPR